MLLVSALLNSFSTMECASESVERAYQKARSSFELSRVSTKLCRTLISSQAVVRDVQCGMFIAGRGGKWAGAAPRPETI